MIQQNFLTSYDSTETLSLINFDLQNLIYTGQAI